MTKREAFNTAMELMPHLVDEADTSTWMSLKAGNPHDMIVIEVFNPTDTIRQRAGRHNVCVFESFTVVYFNFPFVGNDLIAVQPEDLAPVERKSGNPENYCIQCGKHFTEHLETDHQFIDLVQAVAAQITESDNPNRTCGTCGEPEHLGNCTIQTKPAPMFTDRAPTAQTTCNECDALVDLSAAIPVDGFYYCSLHCANK